MSTLVIVLHRSRAVRKHPTTPLSFPRKREPIFQRHRWVPAFAGTTSRLSPCPAQRVIAELARIGEVGHLPAVEIVFGHAFLGEALEAVGIAGGLRAEQAVAADLLGRAAVVDLVELVPAAELAGHGVPQELEQLHALLSLVAVGAAQVAVQTGAAKQSIDVAGRGVEVDYTLGP